MDFRIFAQSLTIREVNELSNHLYDIKREWAKWNAPAITDEEKALVDKGEWIQAIKAVRHRTDVDLLTAKMAVDSYRGK